MKAAIISLGSVSSLMVAEAMKKYFDHVEMIQLKKVEVNLGEDGGIFYEGNRIEGYDCIYVKGSFHYANLLRSISTLLEGNVPYLPLPASAFTTVHNKLLTHLILEQKKIPMPKTFIPATVESAKDRLNQVNYPIVMKFPEGTQGKGVMFADSKSSASSLLDALGVLNQPFIIQEYVETGGSDIRALVVGERVIAAMKRKAQPGEKRANIHAGGKGEAILLGREAAKLAVETAKALQVDLCGVDILESPSGPKVIEANISPGLQGLSEVSPLNIADEIARFFYLKTKEAKAEKNKYGAAEVLKEVVRDNLTSGACEEIITSLSFRGERILLPELITKMTRFSDQKEYSFKARKGKLEINEL